MVISSTNPVHSIFSLILVFANAAALLLLIEKGAAEYLAFLFIIVYVGAIAILFLFVVMMLNIKLVEMIDPAASRYLPIGGIIGVVFLAASATRGTAASSRHVSHDLLPEAAHRPPFGGTVGGLSPFELISASSEITIGSGNNLRSIGLALFAPYSPEAGSALGYVIIASFILFVAMIGAIVLTLSHEKGIKRQDIFSQIQVSAGETARSL
jgi:NADH-quinone oxidoreductase subunit J